jgi:putative endopeptidase
MIPMLIGFHTIQAQDSTKKKPGINVSEMDKKVKPSDDFYRFVNGTWLDNTVIPNDKNSWGSSEELYENTNKDVAKILKDAINNPKYKTNTDEGKAINLYKSILDTVSRNQQGINPLKPYLAKIDAIKNMQDLQHVIMDMEPIGGIGFFSTYIGADDKDSNKNSVNIVP